MEKNAGGKWPGRTVGEWLSSFPVFLLLFLTLLIGTGEMVHGQLLRIGERMFGEPQQGIQYFLLRNDPVVPTCDANPDIDALVQSRIDDATDEFDYELDLLFGEVVIDFDAIRRSLEEDRAQCRQRFETYQKLSSRITPELQVFRNIESGFVSIFRFGTENRPLILLLIVAIAAVMSTLKYAHVSLRPPRTKKDFRVYSFAMLGANLVALASSIYYLKLQYASGVEVERPLINFLTIALFGGLSIISLRNVFKLPAHANEEGSFGLGLFSIPLYAFMVLSAGLIFFLDDYLAGLAIYFGQLTELSNIFLNLILYLWAGMLLKQTQLVSLFMDILRPWRLSPEVFAWVILLASAALTAYTGASGVFVIAAGALVYREMLASGARRRFALASTAMSGSLGVVLPPCLLIVLIAAMNKQVTTTELYGWGVFVFILTASIFLIIALLKADGRASKRASVKEALPISLRALVALLPYIVIVILVAYGYGFLLDAEFDEFTAPVMLPVVMLFVILFEKLRARPNKADCDKDRDKAGSANPGKSLRLATNETVVYTGALIMLMAFSLAVGGMIERSGLIQLALQDIGSIWMALTVFMFMMVFIGMVMDPFGAVILVSATVAPIAYSHGIHPVHFWMIAITAFGLGYLSPPVALNQLLARQVVGEAEVHKAAHESKGKPVYYRFEHWLLPIYAFFTGLVIVTYGGQVLINNADSLRPASSFLGLNHLLPEQFIEVSVSFESAIAEQGEQGGAVDQVTPQEHSPERDPEGALQKIALTEPTVSMIDQGPTEEEWVAKIKEVVGNWSIAWSAKDVESYLSFYSVDFELPGDMTRVAWESQRRARIVNKNTISVELSKLSIQRVGNQEAIARFDQAYESDIYSDRTSKILRLRLEEGVWKIYSEGSI